MVPRIGDMNEDLGVINPAPVWIERSSLSSGFLEAASRVPSSMMMSMFKTTTTKGAIDKSATINKCHWY